MSGLEITCINKDHHGLIVRIGGDGWSFSIHDVIVKIISQQILFNLYVEGNYQQIGVRGEGFDAYLVLEPGGFPLHDLKLPSC